MSLKSDLFFIKTLTDNILQSIVLHVRQRFRMESG